MRFVSSASSLVVLLLVACGPDVSDPDESAGQDSGSSGAVDSSAGDADGSPSGGDDTTEDSEGGSGTSGSTGGADDSGSTTGSVDLPELCAGDRPFSVDVSGVNIEHGDGTLVWVSAVEPDPADERADDEPVVMLETTMAAGAFEVSCPMGLTENGYYPSLAVVIDADGSGACSEGDLMFVQQLYAWAEDQTYAFDGATVTSGDGEHAWVVTEDAWSPVGDVAQSFGVPLCEYYFAP